MTQKFVVPQVDVIEGSRVYIPAIYVINKIDQITLEELNVISKLPHYCPVCAYLEWNLDGLVEMIWDYLDLIRIYTKPKVSASLRWSFAVWQLICNAFYEEALMSYSYCAYYFCWHICRCCTCTLAYLPDS